MIEILIVEDQKLIREGLVALLSLEDDLAVIGEAENGQIAIDLLSSLKQDSLPDVALLDMRMPVMDGVATAAAIKQKHPSIQILVLTTFDEDELIAQAMSAGASGYLLKDTPSEELAIAIRAVAKGYSHFGPGIVQKILGQSPQLEDNPQIPTLPPAVAALTPREKEVLLELGKGANNKEIAERLYLSEGTVKNHVTSILGRLDLRDRTQAALLAQSIQLS